MMMRRAACALAGLLGVILGTPVSADIGVGVSAAPVTLGELALPGQTYSLSPLYVLNTGSETARYSVSVLRITEGDELTAPAEWIALGDNDFVLGAQQSKAVPVTLTVPDNAAPGAYVTHLVARAGLPTQAAGGANLGAAAAGKVAFVVGARPGPNLPFLPPSANALLAWAWPPAPGLSIAVGVGVGLVGVFLLLRALGIRIELQRRRP